MAAQARASHGKQRQRNQDHPKIALFHKSTPLSLVAFTRLDAELLESTASNRKFLLIKDLILSG
jgi:hypothetical protein